MKNYFFFTAFSMSACAADSGVIAIGWDTYMVSRQAATGFSGTGNLKAEAVTEAGQYCNLQKKSFQITNASEALPSFVFAKPPKAEMQFRRQ